MGLPLESDLDSYDESSSGASQALEVMDACCDVFSGGGCGREIGDKAAKDGFLLFVGLRGRSYGSRLNQSSISSLPSAYGTLRTIQAIEIQVALDHVLGDVSKPNEVGAEGNFGRCLLLYQTCNSEGKDSGKSDTVMLNSEKDRYLAVSKDSKDIQVVEYDPIECSGEESAAAYKFEELVRSKLIEMLDSWCDYTCRPCDPLVGNTAPCIGSSLKKISRATAAAAVADEIALEETCHEMCAERLSRELVVVAAPSLSRILRLVRESRQTILVSGPPGAGKSVMLARIARRFSALGASGGWLVLKHFAGAGSAGGGSVREMLRRFCASLAGATEEDVITASAAGTARDLAQRLLQLAVRATGLMRLNLLLVVDGYDMMNSDCCTSSPENLAAGTIHDWIPTADVPGLTVLISVCVVDGASSKLVAALRARRPEPQEVQVPAPTSPADLRLLASAVLQGSFRPAATGTSVLDSSEELLTDVARKLVPSTAGPVWISAAARALGMVTSFAQPVHRLRCGFANVVEDSTESENALRSQLESWTKIGTQISGAHDPSKDVNKPEDFTGTTGAGTAAAPAILRALEQIEAECGKYLSETFFSFLLCESNRGMRESDLLSLLGLTGEDRSDRFLARYNASVDDEQDAKDAENGHVRILAARWVRLRHCVRSLLRISDETGEAAFRLLDSGIIEALEARYCSKGSAAAVAAHRILAIYFLQRLGGGWTETDGIQFNSNYDDGGEASGGLGVEDLFAMAGVARHFLLSGLWKDCVQVITRALLFICTM
jgi:hypothetical protein